MKSERSTIVRRTISHIIREGQHRNAHALALLPGANQQGLPTQVWRQGTPPTSKLNPFGKSRPMLETGPSKTIATLPLHAALQRPSHRWVEDCCAAGSCTRNLEGTGSLSTLITGFSGFTCIEKQIARSLLAFLFCTEPLAPWSGAVCKLEVCMVYETWVDHHKKL